MANEGADDRLEQHRVIRESGWRGRVITSFSFDGNYRAQLWQGWESDPQAILCELVGKADIFFGNRRDISLLLGREFDGCGPERRREAADAAFNRFPGLQVIASTARQIDDADRHRIAARRHS